MTNLLSFLQLSLVSKVYETVVPRTMFSPIVFDFGELYSIFIASIVGVHITLSYNVHIYKVGVLKKENNRLRVKQHKIDPILT